MAGYRVGRIVQVIGMALVATALLTMGAGDMRSPLMMTAVGALVFTGGWLLTGRGRRP